MSNDLQDVTQTLPLPSENGQIDQSDPLEKRQQDGGKRLFVTGLGITSGLTGFLVGTSSAPVIGAMFTGFFGLAVAVIGLYKASQEKEQSSTNRLTALSIQQLGVLLSVLSIAFGAGLVGGVSAKVNNWQNRFLLHPSEPFPWSKSETPPQSIDQALDWICLQAKLTRLGYTPEQVRNLYEQQARLYAQNWRYYQGAKQANPNAQVTEPSFGPEQTDNIKSYCLDASKSADVQTALPSYNYSP